jgi:cystathionine gamma-synthase
MGAALPTDEHACSVSLPTWAAVVGYEEGDPTVTTALATGYPRFVYHRYVVQLMESIVKVYGNPATEDCLVLPTKAAAERCQAFLRQATSLSSAEGVSSLQQQLLDNAYIGSASSSSDDSLSLSSSSSSSSSCSNDNHDRGNNIRVVSLPHVSAVIFPAQTKYAVAAKSYWQHTGEITSSRRAELALRYDLQMDIAHYVTACRSTKHSAAVGGERGDGDSDRGKVVDGDDDDNDTASTSSSTTSTSSSSLTTVTTTTASTEVGGGDNYDDYDLLLRRRIADWTGTVDEHHVFLAPSGMAAIYAALRASRRYRFSQSQNNAIPSAAPPMTSGGGGTSIVFGFPYLDTLKLCSRTELCPDGVEFFGHGNDDDLRQLRHLLTMTMTTGERNTSMTKKNYCALFTEVPSNPLLKTPDLASLRALADEYDFCLIVDDTISNFLNVDVLSTGLADAVCTSLTKLVSGRGDAIAGSIVTNPYTVRGRFLQRDLSQFHDATALFRADARAVYHNSHDFIDRNTRINDTALRLARWFKSRSDVVEKVYYPHESAHYAAVMRTDRPGVGYGGLMSIVLHPHHSCQRAFFDALDVPKGPSLGTNFTLVCPYTLLAHYHELDFAMSYNVQPNLLRIAVGLEPFEELRDKFEAAFRASRL